MKAIQTLALSKYFHSRVACENINLSVNEGEIYGLLGPNGAGKSTLVKMLVGLVTPSQGTARVLGFSFKDREFRQHIGYLPELFRYQPWLSADEVLAFHAGLLKKTVSSERRAELLARVGLSGRERDRVRTFSKGLQQRLGLAVAMVGDPKLIFLDEPTSALDPIGRFEVSQLLDSLRRDGVTIFLNSHLLSDVEKLCDSVALINEGRVLYQGSLEEAINGTAGNVQFDVGHLTGATGSAIVDRYHGMIEWRGDERAALRMMLSRDQVPMVIADLVNRDVNIYEVKQEHSSLEEWFLSRIGKDSH